MPCARDFEELYGVTEEGALNFCVSHLEETIGSEHWSQIRDSTGVYIASVLGHFCLQSIDRRAVLSPDYNPDELEFRQFADLTQIAEMMMRQLTSASKPAPSGLSSKDLLLIGGACLVLVLGAGAIILNVVIGRRRNPRH